MKKYCFPLWKLKPCLLDDCSEWKTAATIGLWAQEAEQMRDGDVGQSWTMLVLYLLIQFHLFFILDRTWIFQGKKKKQLSVSPTIDILVWLVFQSLKPFPSEKPLGSLCAECFFSDFESDSVVHLGWFFLIFFWFWENHEQLQKFKSWGTWMALTPVISMSSEIQRSQWDWSLFSNLFLTSELSQWNYIGDSSLVNGIKLAVLFLLLGRGSRHNCIGLNWYILV